MRIPKNKKIIYYIILLLCVKGFVITFAGSAEFINLAVDLLVFYAAYKAVKKVSSVPIKRFVGKGVMTTAVSFLVVGLVADAFNLVPPLTAFWGARMVVRYAFLFYVMTKYLDAADADLAHRMLYKLFNLNIAACLYEFYVQYKGDLMGGTFKGNGELTIFAVICLFVFSLDYYQKRITLYAFVWRIIAIFVIAMWAEIKFLYFVTPLCLYAGYVLVKKFSIGHLVILSLAFVLLIPTLKFALSFYYGEEYIEKTFDQQEIENYNSHTAYNLSAAGISYNRNTCVEMAQAQFLMDPMHGAIGHGLGAACASGRFNTWIFDHFYATAYFFFTSSYVLIETGWIGYISFLLFYLFVLLRFWHYYRKSYDSILRFWTSLGVSLGGMTFLFIWYNDTPYATYCIVFMVWGFCALAIHNRLKELNLKL